MPRYTTLVYGLVAVGVQALMSWDGGATQNCANAFAQLGWSAAEIGALVGIDRFPGVVVTAPAWGYVLSTCHAKPFLLLAIFAKALSSLLFGTLDPTWKWAMLGARLSMGAWEALFAVWVLGWIGHHGQSGQKVVWLNSLGIAAGAGSGAGGVVTGLLGEHFVWSYRIQAGFLMFVFVAVVFLHRDEVVIRHDSVSSRALVIPLPTVGTSDLAPATSSYLNAKSYEADVVDSYILHAVAAGGTRQENGAHTGQNYREQLRTLLCGLSTSGLWVNTCIAFSLCSYIQAGFTCLWQNTAVYAWNFTQAEASVTLVVVMLLAGFPGIKLGEMWIGQHRSSGENELQQQKRCLQSLRAWAFSASCCGTFASLALAFKVQRLITLNVPQPAWGTILAILLLSIAMLNFIVSGMQGFLCNENREAAPESLRSTANGIQVTVQNLLGFGMGAFLPGVVTEAFRRMVHATWSGLDDAAVLGAQYTFGMASVLLSPWLLYFFTARALQCLPLDDGIVLS